MVGVCGLCRRVRYPRFGERVKIGPHGPQVVWWETVSSATIELFVRAHPVRFFATPRKIRRRNCRVGGYGGQKKNKNKMKRIRLKFRAVYRAFYAISRTRTICCVWFIFFCCCCSFFRFLAAVATHNASRTLRSHTRKTYMLDGTIKIGRDIDGNGFSLVVTVNLRRIKNVVWSHRSKIIVD